MVIELGDLSSSVFQEKKETEKMGIKAITTWSTKSKNLERLQKGAMKIIYPELSYAKALELSGLLTLAFTCR